LSDGTLQYTSRGDYGETKGILSRAIPVIYDDDGSPDGTTALMYLLSDPRVDLKAVNISYGEAHPMTYIQLIGGLLDSFGITNIPLGEGQDGPLSGSNGFPEWMRQSADNFWGMPKPNTNINYQVTNAAQLIVSTLNTAPSPVTIFISGPCTNLAAALRLDPTIKSHIQNVFIMGGAVYVPGNLSDLMTNPTNNVAEWNIYGDPQAAYEVFTSGLDIHLVPLDATNNVKISQTDTGLWRSGGKPALFAADMYDSLMRSNSLNQFAIWDIMTSEIMVTPSLCKFTELHLEVVTTAGDTNGQTSVIPDDKPNVHVCLQPNGSQIIHTLDEVLSASD
jgi:purine nucleosidase/pyrimidine-specific ribonucleoside hydrolase